MRKWVSHARFCYRRERHAYCSEQQVLRFPTPASKSGLLGTPVAQDDNS